MRHCILNFIVVCLSLTFVAERASAQEITGIPKVIDVNTLEIGDQTIILFGMSGPALEENCPDRKGGVYACGASARRTLTVLLQNKETTCKPEGTDSQGRMLATCYVERLDLNQQLVLQGWALALEQESKRYLRDQLAAKVTRSGVWKIRTFEPGQFIGRKP